ncbi:MAG TPA: response regulator transcription factor [Anaerolineales bacterium]
MPNINVLIVDDHPIVCKGIHGLLEGNIGITVVGEAYSGGEALQKIKDLKPDVVLLDMELSDMSGVDVIKQINDAKITLRVLGLSSYDDREFISQLLSNGASGYLLKDEVPEQIIEAIRGVARGETGWVSRKVAAKLSQILQREKEGNSELTPREMDVLKRVVEGKTNGEIGVILGISEKTIEKHLDTIFRKLGVTSRVQAAVLAIRENLV